jgi:quercetin dioxygenase-like cupin family protein
MALSFRPFDVQGGCQRSIAFVCVVFHTHPSASVDVLTPRGRRATRGTSSRRPTRESNYPGAVEEDAVSEQGVRKTAGAMGWREVTAGTRARIQVLLGSDDGMPHFAMRRFQMDVGGGMPLHTNTVEHEQYVLRGSARIRVGERVLEVGPEDVLFIPAGVPHSYEVMEGPFEFLCMVPNLPDRIEIVEEPSR